MKSKIFMKSDNVFFFKKNHENIIDYENINFLKQKAKESFLKRARYCLHNSHSDLIHEMIIVFCKNSYIRPHKHLNKTESFHLIEGSMLIFFFDDLGNIDNKILLDVSKKSKPFFYRLVTSKWHCVVPLSEFVVIHETTNGPYNEHDNIYPTWAPYNEENDKVKIFLNRIMQLDYETIR